MKMHSYEISSSNVPAFLIKLWKLVEDPSCDDLIAWNDSGISFIIKDQAKFASELLPQYFKHNNMASFIRQLNMYGFRKVMNYEKSGLRTDNNEMEFQHSFFVKEQFELLELIKRKIPNTKIIAEPSVKSNAKDILTDLTSIRDKQENMDNMLLKMKCENELLWKELTNMRQKHKQQEQVIEKVIHFLVQVIRNQPVGIQTNMSKMLQDSSGNKKNNSQITTVDLLRRNPDCLIIQDKNSPGPVIHEVTDLEQEEPLTVTIDSPSAFFVQSPVSNKSPVSSTVSLYPKSTIKNDTEPVNQTNDCPFDSSSSPSNIALPLEPLSILEPLQRTPVINENVLANDESILGIPLEYITATDVEASSNATPNSITISIPENNFKSNVITIPQKENISNVLSIPDGSNGKKIITVPTIQNNITVANNVKSIPKVVIRNVSSEKKSNSISLPDLLDNTPCLDELKTNSTNNSDISLSSTLTKNDYKDPLMTDSLNTPKISFMDDVDFSIFSEDNSKEKIQTVFSPQLNVTQQEHNYPVPAPVSSNQIKSSTVKNTLSNHLLTVEEELNRLQDNIVTNSWNVDADKLLGLFSSDGMVNNDSLVNQLTDIEIKKEPDDILDSELIQLTPQLLGVELDELRSPFLIQLDPEMDNSENQANRSSEGKTDLLEQVLNDAIEHDGILQTTNVLNNDTSANVSSRKRRKNSKVSREKRRKLK